MAAVKTVVVADMSAAYSLAKLTQQRRMTLKAVKAGAKIVVPKAKAGAPKRKGGGALRQSQGMKGQAGKRGKTIAFAVVGARTKTTKVVKRGNQTVNAVPSYYSHLVNKGTQAHSLGKGARIGRKGKPSEGQDAGKRHPGAKASHFLDRAWDSTKDAVGKEVIKVAAEEVQKAIAKNAAKVAKKLARK